MATRKTAITIPEDLLADVDRIAAQRNESRSAFITRILRVALQSRRDALVTRRLNELFADEELEEEQLRTAAELDAAGTDWSEEGW
jgi:metal-responsive CopG/Arc/MetJ family transcriptional regulator